MTEFRTVLDTSVVVSAVLLPQSLPRRAFDAAAAVGRLLISADTISELDDVLRRPKFNKYVPEELRLEFLAALVHEAEQIKICETIAVCRDAKDDKFLELAVSGNASHIVSGDDDLLVLHPFRNIAIVSPRDYVALLRETKAEPEVSADGGHDSGS